MPSARDNVSFHSYSNQYGASRDDATLDATRTKSNRCDRMSVFVERLFSNCDKREKIIVNFIWK